MTEVLLTSFYVYISIQWGRYIAQIIKRIKPESSIASLWFWGIVNAIGFPISLNVALYNLVHGKHDKHFAEVKLWAPQD